ncbi:helix-turn-helix transcriptional regulator [Actinacidiphila oryziradicis]|uniref:Helix-turn-helix transcriptional regulator n=1 Tax=Actinacidiphila oryziradicis TaxID=2571141 RepID=A0A4U0SS77_9ACTN|nr:LuxR family transcriptional regulator [Actinacidiphila oryziradicis]TKA10997.1 helix-turn-helix transcriptional regulator [Actinacidiphila oryziradicis]
MSGRVGSGAEQVIGRAELLARAGDHMSRGGSLLLYGPAGIGKSTLLRTLATQSAAAGHIVLRCHPTESESQLPFLALVDLLGEVAEQVADSLPAPQRAALESALTGRIGSAGQRDGLALRLAVLSVLRALAAQAPVLLVADDLQWMDPASEELLAFAARRVGTLPVHVLATVRTDTDPKGDGDLQERFLRVLPPPALALGVPPLSWPQVTELLSGWASMALPRSVLREVHRTSGGNPLFALELGRALVESGTPVRPGEPLPVPTSLRTLVLNRLGMLTAETRRTLLIASAGARPTLSLLRAAGRANAEGETAVAAALGLVELEQDGVVRFTHPLISAALYAEATPRDRRAAHAALAEAASDTIERARHLALAAPGKDEHVALRLAEAADVARGRGAPAVAAQLGLLAARHTPDKDADTAVVRRLDAAEDALTAGEAGLARDTAHEVLADAVRPADRVRAWIVVIDSAEHALADVDDVYPQALADAGDDPGLQALVRYELAWRALLVDGTMAEAAAEAGRAAALAAEAGDRRTELLALAFQAHNEALSGRPDAAATLARATAEPQDPQVAVDHNGPQYIRFRILLMSDRLDEARSTITWLLGEARQRGAVESEIVFASGLAETELRAGRCGAALELARESLRLVEDTGIALSPAYQVAALAEAAGGSVQRAVSLAQDAVRRAETDGDMLFLSRTLYALGHAQLVGADTHGAVRTLRRVRELEREMGVTDPTRNRWHGDLAEALVRAGALAEAQGLIDETRAQALRLGRESVLAVLDRAQGMVLTAQGGPDSAATLLRAARDHLGELGYRLEEARTGLALSRAEQDRGDAGAARLALEGATRTFRRAKALPWLELVAAGNAADAGGIGAGSGGTAPSPEGPPQGDPAKPGSLDLGTLATMEARVAALVLEGATNREIAASLFISVKTVEATLTRVYRKLGVRSRVDIVRLAARRRAG